MRAFATNERNAGLASAAACTSVVAETPGATDVIVDVVRGVDEAGAAALLAISWSPMTGSTAPCPLAARAATAPCALLTALIGAWAAAFSVSEGVGPVVAAAAPAAGGGTLAVAGVFFCGGGGGGGSAIKVCHAKNPPANKTTAAAPKMATFGMLRFFPGAFVSAGVASTSGTSPGTATCGMGGVVFPDLGGATTGNGGGALGAPAAGTDGGGALGAPATGTAGGGGAAGGGAAGTLAAGGTADGGAATGGAPAALFGLSLNFAGLSAAAACAVGAESGTGAGAGGGGAAETTAGGGGGGGTTDAGGGLGGSAAAMGAGELVGVGAGVAAEVGTTAEVAAAASMRGLSLMRGAPPPESAAATGAGASAGVGSGAGAMSTGGDGSSAAGAGSTGVAAAGAAAGSVDKRGLKRILGAAGASAAGGAAGVGPSAAEGGAKGAGAAAAAAGSDDSAGFKRGLSLNAGGGGVCSSLMSLRQTEICRARNQNIAASAHHRPETKPLIDSLPMNLKDSLAVPLWRNHGFYLIFAMTQRIFLTCLLLAGPFLAGCVFSKKPKAPKENPSISREVEESFKRRWLEKRSAEIVAQGETAEHARGQAAREFAARYEFVGAPKR